MPTLASEAHTHRPDLKGVSVGDDGGFLGFLEFFSHCGRGMQGAGVQSKLFCTGCLQRSGKRDNCLGRGQRHSCTAFVCSTLEGMRPGCQRQVQDVVWCGKMQDVA